MNQGSGQGELPVEQLRRFDSICDRFERAWQGGQQPVVRDYLEGEHGERRLELARLILEVDIEQRAAAGMPAAWDAYGDEFPQLRDMLQQRSGLTTAPGQHATPSSAADLNVPHDPYLGMTLGSYKLLDKLGAGGMGAVYRAAHTMIDCERAVKLLHPELSRDPAAVKRFLLEAQACISLSHPHVVTTYHVDQAADGSIYLVMELLRGQSLDKLASSEHPLSILEAARIVEQAASGLGVAHRHGIIHRDIKPHNIFWTDSQAKILDLGLVRLLQGQPDADVPSPSVAEDSATHPLLWSRLTEPHALMGTLPYMAPEQAEDAGQADERSDIYSLGCTFYFLLTGVHAFSGDSIKEVVKRHLQSEYTPAGDLRNDIPEAIQGVLERMMARQPQQRYQSAEAVAEDLARWRQAYEAGAVRTAVDLDDPEALRQALLRLELVSEQDWETAITRAEQVATAKVPNRHTRTHLLARTRKTTQVLQQLERLQEYEDETHGLSEFQTQHILGGNADLLRLPRHVLLRQVGKGWKGEVFAAKNVAERRTEALRTFVASQLEGLDGIGKQRLPHFEAELERLSRLRSPALPAILDYGSFQHRLHGDVAFFSSEFVDGASLDRLVVEARGRGNNDEVRESFVRLLRDACLVLHEIHSQGVFHLDLHPRCIRINRAGQLKLLDLGVARLRQPKLVLPPTASIAEIPRDWSAAMAADSASDDVDDEAYYSVTMFQPPPIGTAAIMAPEQWDRRGTASPQVDIYNLGCTLFFVLTGEMPFGGDGSLSLMEKHLTADPLRQPAARSLPRPYRAVLRQSLAKLPQDRHGSAADLASDLESCLASSQVSESSWRRRFLKKLSFLQQRRQS